MSESVGEPVEEPAQVASDGEEPVGEPVGEEPVGEPVGESGFINPNDYMDNAPPDSLEGLTLDDYGMVDGHIHWGQWMSNLNLWVHQCDTQIYTWWWDASDRVWLRDTTDAVFDRFESN